MVDNVTLPTTGTGTATPVIATDDVSGVHYQIVKLTVGALDSAGSVLVGGNGAVTAGSQRVALGDIGTGEYETVAASATNQVLGAGAGATGDFLLGVLIIPATTSPGAVAIKDGSGTAITIFTGGATSVSNLVPFMVPLGIYSTGGAGGWQITTGTNVSAIGIGNFT